VNMNAPLRPALSWHGGKWRLAPWVISHFPHHRVYVEPFGGAASVLLRKPRSYAEVYNDLDGGVVNLFRVLRSPRRDELIEAVRLTPFARDEFEESYRPAQDDVERARRLVVRSLMGFGSDGHNIAVRTGFRGSADRSGTTPAHDWRRTPATLAAVAERFQGVVIENRPAIDVMRQHDCSDALHYCDPPYLPSTRSQKSRRGVVSYHAYAHEMAEADHVRLLDDLRSLVGAVALSGYPSRLYDDALSDWVRVEHAARGDGAVKRLEVLWLNSRAGAQMRLDLG
jgi:DNA adenine methylase